MKKKYSYVPPRSLFDVCHIAVESVEAKDPLYRSCRPYYDEIRVIHVSSVLARAAPPDPLSAMLSQ